MKETRIVMGMPIEIEIIEHVGPPRSYMLKETLEAAFAYLVSVDEQFSVYKETSEISRINRGEITLAEASAEMKEVFALGEQTKQETNGYFDIRRPDPSTPLGTGGSIDPSGIVKGWAIKNTAALIRTMGCENYFVNAGGDIAMGGKDAKGEEWSVGIRNPFNIHEIVKVVYPKGKGIATSGSYIRGDHIYNPHQPEQKIKDIVSITVIGPDVLAADLMATAAFAMGKQGIAFIENLPGFEGYSIDANGIATLTSGFDAYTSR
ncbi:MAG: FAD:protein FMN transferase [Candidatus Pacebacteria bacterium]|nr:FAD:protein FMN transferase [Candidatus Paceibacterota bacterium]